MGCEKCGGDDNQFCSFCEPAYRQMQRNEPIKDIIVEEIAKAKEEPFVKIFDLHIRALSCHCECLGMNAENCIAACGEGKIPFNNDVYKRTMQKWELIDKEGKPII